MADTLTAIYSWVMPEVGASQNTWGTKWNTTLASQDTIVGALQTSKADLASPTFTGTVTAAAANFTGAVNFAGATTAVTKAAGTNTTDVATTAFVQAATIALMPPGAVQSFAMATVPGGWLECNGASVLRATYPALFTAIGTVWGSVDGTHFTLPDFRGMFLRGWNHGSTRDLTNTSRTFGSFQEHANQDHLHNSTASSSSSTSVAAAGAHSHNVLGQNLTNSYAGPGATYNVMGYPQVQNLTVTDTQGNHAHTATTSTTTTMSNPGQDRNAGSPESKPRNYAVLFCIKT